MQAASQSLQRHRFPEKIEVVVERNRRLIAASFEQILLARELREISGNLRQRNRDFRDFLREQRLLGFSLVERLLTGRGIRSINT